MASRIDYRLKGDNRDSYLRLVSEFPLASIRSDDHLAEAQVVMDRLLAWRSWAPERRCTWMRSAIWSPATRTLITRSKRPRMLRCFTT